PPRHAHRFGEPTDDHGLGIQRRDRRGPGVAEIEIAINLVAHHGHTRSGERRRHHLQVILGKHATGGIRGGDAHDDLRARGDRANRRLAHHVRGREIGLAEPEVDAPRRRAVEELPDRAFLDPGEPARGHRSAASSATWASVCASRYFTITGVYKETPPACAKAPAAAREPGTTTAPAGISSTPPSGRRCTRSCTRSYTGVEPVRIVP